MTIQRILVPTDFSDTAEAALDYAFDLARTLDATVVLAHVFEDPIEHALYYSEQYAPVPAGRRDDMLATIRRSLAELAARGGGSDVTTTILSGPAAQSIAECARDQKIDLIVMGTHGRHGVAHLLLGSVAERVVRLAPCPVLTVRGTGTARESKVA